MKFGIIGSGLIGAKIVRKLRELNHSVRVTNSRGPESLRELTAETGATASTLVEAVEDSDVIFIAVPQNAFSAFPKELFAKLPETVIVVDCGNYAHIRDGRIKELDEESMTEIEWVTAKLGKPVLKAFNSICDKSLAERAHPAGHSDRIALSVAGDNTDHKKVITDLIESFGFDAVDGGSAAESWRQQVGTPAFATDLNKDELIAALQNTDRAVSRKRSDVMMCRLLKGVVNVDHNSYRAFANESDESILAEHATIVASDTA